MKKNILKKRSVTNKLLALQSNMLGFAYSLTMNKDDALDLLQETSVKVLDNEEKFVDNVNFKGWVFTIMRNIFINGYRKQLMSQTLVESKFGDLYDLQIPKEGSVVSSDSLYALNEIKKAVTSLPEEYRRPFVLFLQGYKYEEIAKKMKLPLGTVKSRIFFARKKLQDQLKDYK